MLHAACLSFEVDHLFNGQSVIRDQRVTTLIVSHSIVFLLRKIAFHALVLQQAI